MKTTAARSADLVAWLNAQPREPKDMLVQFSESFRAHVKQELEALLLFVDMKLQEAPQNARGRLEGAREVLRDLIDPRTIEPTSSVVPLDCATCRASGVFGAVLECVGSQETELAWSAHDDGEGRAHAHDPNRRTFVLRCKAGHQLVAHAKTVCWCGWKAGDA